MNRRVSLTNKTKLKDLLIMDDEDDDDVDEMGEEGDGLVGRSLAPRLAAATTVTATTQPMTTVQTAVDVGGQLYVIGSPADVLGTAVAVPATVASGGGVVGVSAAPSTRLLAPKLPGVVSGHQATTMAIADPLQPAEPRDARRRATHNEVERRRRDNINSGIARLARLIPEASNGSGGGPMKSTSSSRSKGDILSRACDYVEQLTASNRQLRQRLNAAGPSAETVGESTEKQRLQRQVDALRQENQVLRQALREHGVVLAAPLNDDDPDAESSDQHLNEPSFVDSDFK